MLTKLIFLGPESTGKTSISREVALQCNAVYVPEFARSYFETHSIDYAYSDVLHIAEMQAKHETEAMLLRKNVVCDTDLLTIKIWLEFYGWEVPQWIPQFIEEHKANQYLLMYPDIPWVADKQRKNPNDRLLIFKAFEAALLAVNANYTVIQGNGRNRFETALSIAKQHLMD